MSERSSVDALVRGYVRGDVDDERMTAWLRQVCADGLSDDDTFALTMAMARSGDMLDWSDVAGPIVDKHSTGGVGDAVSLIAVPLAAACGAKVAKLSGRALGHTGGTIDKLECIPGLRTELSVEAFRSQVERVGCAIAAATAALAPADKRLYALRHRTDTVASIPLIASSIMSKKLAAGAPAIVLDVKAGAGAFMTDVDEARALARAMRGIGQRAGRAVATIVTRMDDPLAGSVGDALELDEALTALDGAGGSPQLREAATVVASAMVRAAGLDAEPVARVLASGAAAARFSAMAQAQGGELKAFDRAWPPGRMLRAERSGFVAGFDALRLGEAVTAAKAAAKDDGRRLGVRLHKRRGDSVCQGDVLLEAWLPPTIDLQEFVYISEGPPETAPLVIEVCEPEPAR